MLAMASTGDCGNSCYPYYCIAADKGEKEALYGAELDAHVSGVWHAAAFPGPHASSILSDALMRFQHHLEGANASYIIDSNAK